MTLKIKRCDSCKKETSKGKPSRTGLWLCNKCYTEIYGSDDKDYVSISSMSKIKKIKNKRRRNLKIVKTKLHENGFQSRLKIE